MLVEQDDEGHIFSVSQQPLPLLYHKSRPPPTMASSRSLTRPLIPSSSLHCTRWILPSEVIKACRPIRYLRLHHSPSSARVLQPPHRTTLPSPLHPARPWQQSRTLNTARREYLKRQLKFSGKFIIYSWIFGGLGLWGFYTFNHERLERVYPSPPVWKDSTRTIYRNAKLHEEPEAFPNGVVDWVVTANIWKHLVTELEDPKSEGAELIEQEGGIPGMGKMGYDIESKPEPWRRGYHEALMGAAKGAENLDGFVRDKARKIVFPPDVVIGPSNPNPRPVPKGAADPPLEEDCEPAFESPEVYYTRILTTKGFTTGQRLVAALAYADWLDFKHLSGSAKEMYSWALDIATSATQNQGEQVVDVATGVIKPDARTVSSNVLLATTSLATHEARNGNLSAALSIFLSVLRARRALPPPPPPPPLLDFVAPEKPKSLLERDVTYVYFRSLLRPLWTRPAYPDPPPSGDEQALRTATSICEEAGLMANIGEILYTTASTNEGLAWTREAVEVAESQFMKSTGDQIAVEKCRECLDVATGNWLQMVVRLAEIHHEHGGQMSEGGKEPGLDAQIKPDEEETNKEKTNENIRDTEQEKRSWFWRGSSRSQDQHPRDEEEMMSKVDWDKEQTLVEKRAGTIRRMIDPDRFEKKGGAWFGTMIFG